MHKKLHNLVKAGVRSQGWLFKEVGKTASKNAVSNPIQGQILYGTPLTYYKRARPH